MAVALGQSRKLGPTTRRKKSVKDPGRADRPTLDGVSAYMGFVLRLAQLELFQDFDAQLAAENITSGQFCALCIVRDNPGLNQAALAEALRAEAPRMVALVDILARRGYVARLTSMKDRRSSALYLTPEGASQLRRLCAKVVRHDRRLARRLRSGTREQLLQMLQELAGL